jgi:regulator of protease activity HflC (stomatin/prohibitin superfamily)
MLLQSLGGIVVAALLLWILSRLVPIKRVTIYEYQQGLKYSSGRYAGTLDPGRYWILSAFSSIVLIDVRPEFITIQGQDVLSADGVTLKISLAAEFRVVDANIAVNKNANFRTTLYLSLQMALREIVGQAKIDALLENRGGFSAKLMELTVDKARQIGLELISADVKDIMFPGELKKVFAQFVKAQKDGQASLERARGETAALRSLANAARAIEDNPSLLQLRALQTMADSTGNTLILGLPNGAIPFVKQDGKIQPRKPSGEEEEAK